MKKWAHKVRSYTNSSHYSGDEYPSKAENSQGFVGAPHQRDALSIEEWLDWQCEGGWELFKFHPRGSCVFRKLI